MKCIHCNNPHTYLLADSQRKCSKCKKKFSPKKIERERLLYRYFCEGKTARETALLSQMHFATVLKYFNKFRHNIICYADEMYQLNTHRISAYDEYLYLPKTLEPVNNIQKLQHFLTMSYDNTIYCIMMPTTKHSLLQEKNSKKHKLLDKYLTFNKISKIAKSDNIITEFWNYFEKFICQYKGINCDNFILYLKEAEWRFNLVYKGKQKA